MRSGAAIAVLALVGGCYASRQRPPDATAGPEPHDAGPPRDGGAPNDVGAGEDCARYRRTPRAARSLRVGRVSDGRVFVVASRRDSAPAWFIDDRDPLSTSAREQDIPLVTQINALATNAFGAVAFVDTISGSAIARFGPGTPRVTAHTRGLLPLAALGDDGVAFAAESRVDPAAFSHVLRFDPASDALSDPAVRMRPGTTAPLGFPFFIAVRRVNRGQAQLFVASADTRVGDVRLTRIDAEGGFVDRVVIGCTWQNPYRARTALVTHDRVYLACSDSPLGVSLREFSLDLDLRDEQRLTLPVDHGACKLTAFDARAVLFCAGPPPDARIIAFDVAARAFVPVEMPARSGWHVFEDIAFVAPDRAVAAFIADDSMAALAELCVP